MRVRVFFSYLLIAGGLAGLVVTTVLRARGVDVPGSPLEIVPSVVGLGTALVLVRRVPSNRIGFVLSLVAFTGPILNVTTPLVRLAVESGQVVRAIVLTQLANAIFPILIVSLLVLLPLWFPTGRAIGPKWEWVWKVSVFVAVLVYVAGWFAERTCLDSPDGFGCAEYVTTPWGIPGWDDEVISPIFALVFVLVIPAIASGVVRFRRSRGVERQQLRLFAVSIAITGGTFLANVVAGGIIGSAVAWFQSIFSLAFTAALVSIGVAVLRYRLYEIDRIISRTITYTIVVSVLAGSVALVATVVGTQFESPFAVAATTLAVAALFNPLRHRVHAWVDRRFNRSRYEVERVIDEFASSLRDETDSDRVMGGWVGVVTQTMHPSSLGVWLRP